MRIAVLSSYTPSLFWFRMDMMLDFIRHGHEVIAIGNEPELDWVSQFADNGIEYHAIEVQRNGTNPIKDLRTYRSLLNVIRQVKPDKLFTYQAKTVIYGGLAARCLGIKEVYPLIAGIGSVFLARGLKASILRRILKTEYKLALRTAPAVFFQNPDDVAVFVRNGIIPRSKVVMLRGSGVNLDTFMVQPLPEKPAFLCISRLIRDKGIMEYLQACRNLKAQRPDCRCLLIGPFDSNPTAIKPGELQPYIDEGTIEYFGEQADVRPYLAQASVYVLPSYREGTPKSILEAMASGRAIVTTNAPGCRETVIDGQNGYLVPVKDIEQLSQRMLELADNPSIIQNMAALGRRLAVEKFDVSKVNAVISTTMNLLQKP